MKKEKVFKRHENRSDLAGEHAFGDLGQVVIFVLFLVVWIADSFFLAFSTQYSDFTPLYVRIPLAVIILILAGYLARKGLNAVFGEVREEPAVIRTGVFSVVRHPIYLGAILVYFSFLVVIFSIGAALVWVVAILFYIYLCKHEEKLLLEKFGSDYQRYRKETPMLIPRLIRKSKSNIPA